MTHGVAAAIWLTLAAPPSPPLSYVNRECGVAFQYPRGFVVSREPHTCTLEVRVRKPRGGKLDEAARSKAVLVEVTAVGVEAAVAAEWTLEDGSWFRGGPARRGDEVKGPGWWGLSAWIDMRCYPEGYSGSVACSGPVATIGTPQRSAELSGEPDSEVTFDTILHSFEFLGVQVK